MNVKYAIPLAVALTFAGTVLLSPLMSAETDEKVEAIKTSFSKLFKGETPDAIAESTIPGIYEITMGTDVIYSSDDGRYLIYGDIIDSKERINITEEAKNRAEEKFTVKRKALMKKQDDSKAIVFKAKDEKYKLTVFTDIDCPYCVKFHKEMKDLNEKGVTVSYLMFPRAGLKSKSYDKAVSAWCADDQQDALTKFKNREPVPSKTCENPVAEQYALGQQIGVNGTPALVTESGRLIPGYMPATALVSQLKADKEASSVE